MKYIVYILFLASLFSGSMVAYTETVNHGDDISTYNMDNDFVNFSNDSLTHLANTRN